MGKVHQVSVSKGGVPKLPVDGAHVGKLGLSGDDQDNKIHHGGPERAVCLYSLELIERLRADGHPIVPGSVGENLTVAGVPWDELAPGARLRVGERVLLEISSYTTPCKKIAGSFEDGRFARVSQKTHPGESRLYARVLEEGDVRPGDDVELIPREARVHA